MIMDKHNTFCTNQAVTVSAASTDHIDQGAKRDVGLIEPMQICLTVTEAATAAGAATVKVGLQCDDNDSFSSAKTVIETPAIAKDDLVVGKQIFLPLPIGLDERYIRLYFTVATGPLTAGKFSAALVHGVQANTALPDAL